MAQQKVDLTRCVGRLECGRERGGAFFLKPDLAITCRHCVLPRLLGTDKVVIHVGGEAIDADLTEPVVPEEHDTILLRLAKPVTEDRLLPLVASHLPQEAPWDTFGFPHIRAHGGMALRGIVAASLQSDDTPRDIELRCTASDLPSSFRGFSGSPVVVGGTVRAVMQVRLDGGLGAISLWRLRGYLEAARVVLRSGADEEPLAAPLRQEIERSVPNRRTIQRLESCIGAGRQGYVLLTGSPGTGKTLLVAGFRAALERFAVVGRYFASGNAENDLPPAFHGRLATFAQWLSNEAGLRSREAVNASKESSAEERIQSIAANMAALAGSPEKVVNVLLIDGAEADGPTPTEFVQHLPRNPPVGLAVVIATTNSAAFRAKFPDLQIADEVPLQPLPQYDCEWLVAKRLAPRLGPSAVARVAQESLGHPLTLNYLINDVAAALERGDADPLASLEGTPGGLEDYYARLWARLGDHPEAQYLLSLIARLRQGVPQSQLVGILPAERQPGFLLSLGRVRHLLRVDSGCVRLYHDSFRAFVLARSHLLDGAIHGVVARYCESAPEAEYSVANVLYHRFRGGADPRATAQLCNQEWADRAADLCVSPELVLSDIADVLTDRLRAGDLRESVRLLLLRSRMEARYNRLFALFAAEYAGAILRLHSPRLAVGCLVREGRLLCTPDETLTLLRALSVGNHGPELRYLFQEFRRRCWATYEQGPFHLDLLLTHLRAACVFTTSDSMENIMFGAQELRNVHQVLEEALDQSGGDETANGLLNSNAFGAVQAELLWRFGFAACDPDDPVELAAALEEARTIAWEHGYIEPRPNKPEIPEGAGGHRPLSRSEIGAALGKSAAEYEIPNGAAELVAGNLLRVSDAFERVGELYKSSAPVVADVSLRAENGVDANLTGLQCLIFGHEVTAFVADPSVTVRVTSSVRRPWERRFIQAAERLGEIRGAAFRSRALGQSQSVTVIEQLKRDVFPLLRFSLRERAAWRDSYHIPEILIPRLALFAADAVTDLEPTSSAEFARSFLDNSEHQAGLYTEGYQRLLAILANVLSSTPHGEQPAGDLRRALKTHVERRVFARKERVADLLDCAHHLARLGAVDDAGDAFKEAVRSSLGPTWYKEDQFHLVLDALEVSSDPEISRTEWKRAAEILAFASGESTFQRFVRQQKEGLIRHLSVHGLASQAVALHQHYVSPGTRHQRSRVTRVGVDMTSKLAGGSFGVLEIDEQSGALALLSGMTNASPLLRWAVVELFWPWGDDRYFRDFAGVLISLLSSASRDAVGERFLRCLRADVDPAMRGRFCGAISAADTMGVVTPWLESAQRLGIFEGSEETTAEPAGEGIQVTPSAGSGPDDSADVDDDGPELFLPGVFGRRKSLKPLREATALAQERVKRGDIAAARRMLVDAVQQAQSGGWDVWESRSSANVALRQVFGECGPPREALRSLADLVLGEEHAASWRVAQELLTAAVPHLDASCRHDLVGILFEHVGFLVRPERCHITLEGELEELPNSSPSPPPDECLEDLLLSQLDHANVYMAWRAADVIDWLVRRGALRVDAIVARAAREGFPAGRELAVGLLHRLALCPQGYSSAIAASSAFEQLRKRGDILSRCLVEDVGATWEGSGRSSTHGPASAATPTYRWSFDPSGLFDTLEGSAEEAARVLIELSTPMTPGEVDELADIRRQAFSAPRPQRGNALEREAIFRALAAVLPSFGRLAVTSWVMWNPLWPEADLRLDWSPIAPRIIDAIESGGAQAAFQIGDKTVLHCVEVEPPERDRDSSITEVVAVLVADNFFRGDLDMNDLWEVRSVHQRSPTPVRSSILARLQDHAVARFPPLVSAGGGLTPAFPSQRLIQLIGNHEVERVVWRDGRRWDMWGPGPELVQGTATLIDTAKLDSIPGHDLVWVILRDKLPTYIVYPKRNHVYDA